MAEWWERPGGERLLRTCTAWLLQVKMPGPGYEGGAVGIRDWLLQV